MDLATKFGISFADGKQEIRGDPAYVRAACEGSLKRLGVDCVDLYYQHRIDKRVPIEVTVSVCYPFLLLEFFFPCFYSFLFGHCSVFVKWGLWMPTYKGRLVLRLKVVIRSKGVLVKLSKRIRQSKGHFEFKD